MLSFIRQLSNLSIKNNSASSLISNIVVKPSSIFIANKNNENTTTASIHTSSFDRIKLAFPLCAEPTKAKKRIDPALLAAKEGRKKKRLERDIKKMERLGRKLKPIEELEPDRALAKETSLRKRPLGKTNKEQEDDEHFLKKEWSIYTNQQHQMQLSQIQAALKSQELALKELKKDNLSLYNMAIQLDESLTTYTREGPVHTPANQNYDPPEGDYQDVTYLYDRR